MNNIKNVESSLKDLEIEYRSVCSLADKFCVELKEQLIELLLQNQIPLAFPIECRVKTWDSLSGKLEDKLVNIASVKEIDDLIGFRIILLFRSDLDKTYDLIENNFKVIERDDTERRLRENEFGYLSVHYIIELPDSWFAIPTFSSLHGFKAEIQVRTAAQHIWAAASHKLQYKQESGVPIPVRRSIHRVSALLETVDLELDRVLGERAEYINKANVTKSDEPLNVDLLERVLESILPAQNKDNVIEGHAYSGLLEDLFHFKINTKLQLTSLLEKHLDEILRIDSEQVNEAKSKSDPPWKGRLAKGVYFTHIGLTRIGLRLEFGDAWIEYSSQKNIKTKKLAHIKKRKK